MQSFANNALAQFRNRVAIRFQLYNSLFTSLPFHRIEKTGVWLSLFLIHCEEGYKNLKSPVEIIESFLSQYTNYKDEREQLDMLFRFIQYAERQVVLFDALEDASFEEIHDVQGQGSLKQLLSQMRQYDKQDELEKKINDFSVRLVLTAHPTQFYPGEVLSIINDLAAALNTGDTPQVNEYLMQLAKTPFLKKKKPTPYDEAVSLIWYLENVFYPAAGKIVASLQTEFPDLDNDENAIIRMGFWPGGDRDGNPYVKSDTTVSVAQQLHRSIIYRYYKDIRKIKHRLTFKGIEDDVATIEKAFYGVLFEKSSYIITKEWLLEGLNKLRKKIIEQHNGLFVQIIDELIGKVKIFGIHFATIDIRQDSTVHHNLMKHLSETENGLPKNYAASSIEDKIKIIGKIKKPANEKLIKEDIYRDTFDSMKSIKTIQKTNGEFGCNRYIISHCTSLLDVMEVFALLKLSGWKEDELTLDILPLFETIEDLQSAGKVMEELYNNALYRKHLNLRNNKQTIMLGFSDGTKDGGYLMANWSIYKAKEELTRVSKEYDIDVIFFDGRGGPPARGGGKTQKFYASMGSNIANKEIQLTVQGQTVSSNFGTIESAKYNIEQLLNAGISNDVLNSQEETLTKEEETLLAKLSEESLEAYNDLKNAPHFMEYLSYASPLKFYGSANIGSRPSKRNASSKLTLNDLRAIPYVGAWSQLKQNVTGYYGVGTALQKFEKAGKFKALKDLYKNSLFFRTMIDNSEMSMKKCFFPLTQFHAKHPKYAELWQKIYDEYLLTEKMVLRLSGQTELMSNYPVESMSIQMRERIVLPLVTIQQYGLVKYTQLEQSGSKSNLKEVYETLIMRCSFGIINAGRNSA
ncbi:MAG: phosphoenolpyruvate carboxylase [Arachidicoccus sp.]|nr:phosphoenolpyruvate carboxylase [Arachidicoccus sp.]